VLDGGAGRMGAISNFFHRLGGPNRECGATARRTAKGIRKPREKTFKISRMKVERKRGPLFERYGWSLSRGKG